ncbi:MAG TPA: hopanoid-associated sugar epimerase [Rhodoblastus sp.]|nr:hopanoid-associated sugar epimerase [Rhodoblastus sp.]
MNSSGKTLVTGATGFVGAAVARALIARGERVVLLARKSSVRGNIEGLDAEVVEGDLRDAASLRLALRGVERLYHVAADYRMWAPDPREIIEANRVGTANIMTEALRAEVSRIVYCSSVATLKLNGEGRPVDETSPAAPDQAIGAYKKSKTIAERLVEQMVAEQGLPAVIVNPSTPIGPRDIKPTPTGRIIVEAASGRMPGFVDTGLNLVHVDDVAAGHLAAMDRGRIGERYILGGQDAPLGQMLAEIAALVGRKAPKLKVPRRPLYPLAYGAEAVARFTRREPFITADALRMAKYRMYFCSAKAEQELGYVARPYAQALADAVEWFRGKGMIA